MAEREPLFAAGDHVGAYAIVRRIGAGGMGEVFEARHRHIARGAAIKVLLSEFSSNEDVVKRFFNEARAASTIRHPGIVEILDCDVHAATGRAYIVMELLSGEDLRACLARAQSFRSQLTWVAAICGQIAEALVAAHAKGITHRDLKPDNIFLVQTADLLQTADAGASTTVKVLDFGVAKLMAEGGAVNATQPGALLGTPLYMSPEQCRGAGKVDHRADIYSLGCMIFELIVGRPPFMGEGAGDLFVAHLSEPPPELTALAPETPPGWSALVGSMLAKDPDRRPQSMLDVARELEGFLGARAGSAAIGRGVAGGTQILLKGQTTLSEAATEGAPLESTFSKRRRTAIGGAAVLAVAGIAFFLLRPGPAVRAIPVDAPAMQAPAPAAVHAEPTAPPPGPAKTIIEITSSPKGAEVWLGSEDKPRGVTPLALSLLSGAAAQQVALKAAGYVTKTISVQSSHDDTMNVQLEKEHHNALPHHHEHEHQNDHEHQKKKDPYAPVGD